MLRIALRILAITVMCAHPLIAQTADIPEFGVSFDRFTGRSTATLELGEVGEGLELSLWLSFPGKHLSKDGGVAVVSFHSVSRRWQYLDFHPIAVLVDGQRMPGLRAEHRGHVLDSGVSETITASLTREQLRRLVTAKRVEFRVGLTELPLDDLAVAGFRQFADWLDGKEVSTDEAYRIERERKASALTRIDSLLSKKP